uniref:ANK_REP_REGION domain-containing protein n=1 Tax=Globodera pallida TaxID=36090 RepID=A0A183CMU1_GLOPA
MSASSSRSNDQPKSSHKGADQKQFIVSLELLLRAANRSVVLSETEVQLEKLALDTQRDQKKKSDACANEGEEVKKFFKLAERGGAAGMRAMLKGPNADVLLSAKVNGVTALSVAIQNGNAEVVELLIEPGSDGAQIAMAYFHLAMKFHPNVSKSGNPEPFLRIKKAYDFLRGMDAKALEMHEVIAKATMPCPVFAERPIPKKDSGFFYYEVNILKKNALVRIGLMAKQTPLTVGRPDLYAYQSNGILYGLAPMPNGRIRVRISQLQNLNRFFRTIFRNIALARVDGAGREILGFLKPEPVLANHETGKGILGSKK